MEAGKLSKAVLGIRQITPGILDRGKINQGFESAVSLEASCHI